MCHLGLNTNYTETEPEAEIVIFPYKSYNYLENQCPFELSNYKNLTKISKSEKEVFIKTSNFKKEQLLHNSVTCVKCRAGKNNFLPGSTTWRQKFPVDQQSIFVLNLHVHKHILF